VPAPSDSSPPGAARYWPVAPLRRYLVAVILLATLPLAALMSYRIVTDVRGEQGEIEDNLSRSASALSQAVDSELIASLDALTALSHAEVLRQGRPAQIASLLNAQPRPRRDWHSVFLMDAQGRVVFDTAGTSGQAPGADLADLHQRTVRRSQQEVSGLVGATPAAPQAVLLAVPVVHDGGVRFVLGARVHDAVWQRLADAASRPEGGHALLFDAQQRLISTTLPQDGTRRTALPPEWAETLRGRPFGVQRAGGIDGSSVYAAWQSVPAAGWGVQVAIPAGPIDAAHRQAILTAFAASGGSLLVGVLLATLAARRIARPLQQLASEGHAGLPGRIPVKEIGMLRDALRQAALQDEAARAQLAATAQEFQTLFDSSPIGMAFAQDTQCRRVRQNAAMDALVGPRDAAEGAQAQVSFRRAGQLLAPDQLPLQRAAADGETVLAEEIEVLRPGHRPVFLIANAVPLRDAAGRPRGAISALVDISERKQVEAQLLAAHHQLHENQRLMDLAQEAGHVGFFHYQLEGDELVWTPGHCKLFDSRPLDGIGIHQWFDRIDEGDRQRVEREFWTACALRRENATLEYWTLRGDGARRWLSSRLLLHCGADGAVAQVTGVTVDMSDQREAEVQRVQLTERALAARQQAEAASRAKDEFLTMLSHELRNPLGAISAAIDVLDAAVPGTPNAAEARAIIARQTRNLAHMMNDLLDVGRVIAGKILLARQPVNLAAVFDRVHRTLQVTREAAGHELQLKVEDAWVDGDAVRIEQVMTNLVTNAIKYTPAGRRIAVTVERRGGDAVFEVTDSGMGIPPNLLPHIFDLFVQGERTLDRRAGGLGIGLTLVRRLVELHGGTIEAASSDAGSRFRVTLPAAEPPTRAEGDALPPSRRRRVLVVDDNADVLAALRSKLELDGHSVSTAADGIDGLDSLLRQQPEVSIVDIGLPGLTGYELARHARAAGYAGRMIALSGYGAERDVTNALTAGFDAYLVKPVDRSQLRSSLSAD
jgi:signal transduction histidine kinase/CheY-like chemotaxis protein